MVSTLSGAISLDFRRFKTVLRRLIWVYFDAQVHDVCDGAFSIEES